MSSANKISKRTPLWHAEAVATIRDNFTSITTALLDATRRAVWLGLFLNHIKARGKEDGSIPHGLFRKWLEKNLPDLSRSSIAVYMAIGRNVMEKAELPFSKVQKLDFSHPGELPGRVEKIIAGKDQRDLQPFLEYKQAKVVDDYMVPAVGRLKGQGGATKLQREAAQQAAAASALEAQTSRATEFTDWLLGVSDDAHAGQWPQLDGDKLYEACETFAGYWGRLRGARRLATRKSASPTHTPLSPTPKGLNHKAQGCESASYPGSASPDDFVSNPEGVASASQR